MRGIRKGANLLYETRGKKFNVNIDDTHKGHYKLIFEELPKKKGRRKKSYPTIFLWMTIKKFKKEAKRLKMKVLKKSQLNQLKKEGV